MFSVSSRKPNTSEDGTDSHVVDIEDSATKSNFKPPVATVTKRKRGLDKESLYSENDLNQTWREVLGNPPPIGNTKVWLFPSIIYELLR